jgi:hypothetical protein
MLRVIHESHALQLIPFRAYSTISHLPTQIPYWTAAYAYYQYDGYQCFPLVRSNFCKQFE